MSDAPSRAMLRLRLAIVTFTHFIVDFYVGVRVPLIEPTLTDHLGVTLGSVMLLVGLGTLCVHAIQPLYGVLFPRGISPWTLALCPVIAALVCLMGLIDSYWLTAGLFCLSGLAIGVLHPEGMTVAHDLAGDRQGLGMAIYLSGGFFGYSLGGVVGAEWVTQVGFSELWLLAIPGFIAPVLVFGSGLHRHAGHMDKPSPTHIRHQIPFLFAFLLALMVVLNFSFITNSITPWLVRRFGAEAQVWGARSFSAFGIAGAMGSFLWAHLSEKRGRCLFIAGAGGIGLPILHLLLQVDQPMMACVWMGLLGFFAGGVFPLAVVLGRGSPGETSLLRTGLMIGGVWGSSAVANIIAGRWIDWYSTTTTSGTKNVEAVQSVMHLSYILMPATVILALLLSRREYRTVTN